MKCFRIYFVIFIAFILNIYFFSSFFIEIKPFLFLILILYFQFYFSYIVNPFFIFCIGVILDVLSCTVLGQNSFSLNLTIFFLRDKIKFFNFLSFIQKLFIIGYSCCLYQVSMCFINILFGYYCMKLMILIVNVLLSIILWPFVYYLMNKILF
ncbi:rod shape-determining protein MreD [Candidatus Legionella polyplacis]|uniref:Rod shape-determining protein MreD n=1 Tax=Candidatus Legionella polyplacis TaxID=2005262 RepID=A0ABZ2GYR2_9GAMM|nr:rod shape-determining protein MreD [Candidatus Legionella polyplacis]ATW02010.1 rod shape-determining protein MreD [Candidatus Legionella polyplacis]